MTTTSYPPNRELAHLDSYIDAANDDWNETTEELDPLEMLRAVDPLANEPLTMEEIRRIECCSTQRFDALAIDEQQPVAIDRIDGSDERATDETLNLRTRSRRS